MVTREYTENEIDTKKRLMDRMIRISFPRLIGTENEPKAIKTVKKMFEEEGFTPVSQPVQASLFRINFLQSLANILGGLLFILATFLYSIHPLLFLIPVVVIIVELSMVSSGSPAKFQPPNVPKGFKIFNTENIYGELNCADSNNDSGKKPLQIVFMGHWDSKSTVLNGLQRVLAYVLFMLAALGVLGIGIVGLILYIIPSVTTGQITILTLLWIFAIVGAVAGIILSINVVGNKSPGACDNATSVGAVIECARYFKEHPIENVNFTFLLTTAEEIGLTGAYNFIKNRKDLQEWSPERTFVINWDLAGLKGPVIVNEAIGIPKKHCSATMSKYLPKIAEEQEIEIKQLYLPVGGWTDSLAFNYYGYESFTIAGTNGATKVHASTDTPDIIDEDNFFQSWLVGVELAKKLAKNEMN